MIIGPLPELPSPKDQAQAAIVPSISVDREPSNATLRGATQLWEGPISLRSAVDWPPRPGCSRCWNRLIPTAVVSADAVAVAFPCDGRVVGVAWDVGPLRRQAPEVRAPDALAPLDIEDSLVRRIVLPGEHDQRAGLRGSQAGWRSRRRRVRNDGTCCNARRSGAIGDRQGRLVTSPRPCTGE